MLTGSREAASVNIEALFKKYGNFPAGEEPWKKYGRVNDWNSQSPKGHVFDELEHIPVCRPLLTPPSRSRT